MEIWKDIEGYNGHYQVSDQGFVRSRIRGSSQGTVIQDDFHIMKESYTYGRHPKVKLTDLNKKVKKERQAHEANDVLVAPIVLETFVGKPKSDDYEALHINGKPHDVRLKNLRWGNRKEMVKLMRKNGSMAVGELLPQAKICDQEALEIKHLLCNTPYSLTEIGDIYGVDRALIAHIYRDEYWTHIPWPGKIIKKVYRTCNCCGGRFKDDRFKAHGQPQKYCSGKCRSRYHYLKSTNQKYEDVYGA